MANGLGARLGPMSLPARPTSTAIGATVEAIVAPYRTATIEIWNPLGAHTTDAAYNPNTDSGGNKVFPAIWGPVPARIQSLGLQIARPALDEWGDKTNYHFDIALDPAMPVFHKGLRIRVKNGGDDPSLTDIDFTIQSAQDSSLANQRTIFAITEGAPLV